MQKEIIRFKHFLSHKLTGAFFLVIAIAVKISMQLNFFCIDGDKSSQLLAAKNFLAGYGLTLNRVFLNDLSSEKFIPLVGWPPGYSIVLSPLLWIFNNDYKTAALVFDIACIFPFFFYLVRIVNYLNLQKWLKHLFILFAGFFFYPVGPSTCTDFISLSCILAGFYYLLLFMRGDGRPLRLVFFISISLFLAGFFRYNYIPVAFSFPILLGIAGFINKKNQWIKGSFQIGFVVGTLLLSLLIFQHYYTGSATYINTRETGFFPENLLQMYPVVPASFFDVEIYLSVFTNFSGGDYLENGKILRYAGYIFFILLSVYGIWYLKKNKLRLKGDLDYFTYAGIGVSFAITCLLFYFSARNSAFLSPFYSPWTYIQEFRYFVFITLFIQLVAFVYLFNRFGALSRFWKTLAIFCASLIIIQFSHRVYYVSKLTLFSRAPFYTSPVYENETGSIIRLFRDVASRNTNYEIIVASPDKDVCNYAAMENIKAIYDSAIPTLSQQIASSVPVKIILVIPARMIAYYEPALSNPSLHYFGEVQNRYFYILDVTTKQQ